MSAYQEANEIYTAFGENLIEEYYNLEFEYVIEIGKEVGGSGVETRDTADYDVIVIDGKKYIGKIRVL